MNKPNKEDIVEKPNFTDEEIGFRRGFAHGVAAHARGGVTVKQADIWRNSSDLTCPPGTGLAGLRLNGLTRESVSKCKTLNEVMPEI